MAEEIKIVAKIVTDGEKQAKAKAKKIGNEIAAETENRAKKLSFGERIKQQLEGIKTGIEAIGVSGDKLGKIGALFKGGGVIAIGATIILGIAKSAMALWDKVTVSAEEMAAKIAFLKKTSAEKMNLVFDQQQSANSYLKRLDEINQQEVLSNASRIQAIAIIEQLSKSYGELGLSIDETTGKIVGLEAASKKALSLNQQRKVQASKKVLDTASSDAGLSLQQAFKKGFWSNLFFGDLLNIKFAEELQKKGAFAQMSTKDPIYSGRGTPQTGSPYYKNRYNPNPESPLSPEQLELVKKWNSGIQGKIEYAYQMAQKSAADSSERQKWEKAYEKLVALKKAMEEYQNIKKTGFRTNKEFLQHLASENKFIDDQRKKMEEQIKTMRKVFSEKENAAFFNSLSMDAKIQFKEVEFSENRKISSDLKDQVKELQAVAEAKKKAFDVASKGGSAAQSQKAFAELSKAESDLLKKREEYEKSMMKGMEINAEINRLLKQRKEEEFKNLKNDDERLKSLRAELDYLKMVNEQLLKRQKALANQIPKKQETVKKAKEEKSGLQAQEKSLLDFKYKGESKREDLIKAVQEGKKKFVSKNAAGEEKEYIISDELFDFVKQRLQKVEEIKAKIKALDLLISSTEKSITSDQKKKATAERQQLKTRMEILTVQNKIKELNERNKKYHEEVQGQLKNEIQIQTLLLQGKFAEAERQKIINDLKKQGLKLDQKQVDEQQKLQQKLKGVQLDRDFKKQGLDLIDSTKPKNRQTEYERRVRQLEEQNGMSLTNDQKKKVRTLVDVEFKLKEAENLKPNFSDIEIKSNEMTQRGGWAGGAVSPSVDLVNKQIRDYNSKLVQTTAQIKALLQKGGII